MRCAAAALIAGQLLLSACTSAAAGRHPTDAERAARRVEISAMLDHAAVTWNHGDLATFVDDYLPGSETTYVGGKGLLRGPDAIRGAYAPRFAPGGVRDSLAFELLDVDPIAPDITHVIAIWQLMRHVGGRDSVTGRGPTSLLMRRVDGRWRIVHDHSS